jgi:hypothetical protein
MEEAPTDGTRIWLAYRWYDIVATEVAYTYDGLRFDTECGTVLMEECLGWVRLPDYEENS